VADGVADPGRVGITGISYGGYMTAWAAATSDRFQAAVMISGISNLLSCHYACNHAFCEFIVGGPHWEAEPRRLMIERSPMVHVSRTSTPTLILHGREDLCTPLGQAEEFYRALADQGVETELVIYPREGHGFQERAHQLDAWQRIVAWFNRHLQGRA
jgi:dipeptidyl aminopeptidase/acylaminoacyl peptidase